VSRFAIFRKKERWALTWFGRLLKLLLILGLGLWYFMGIHPFLATTHPVDAELMVVEGFIPDYAVEQAGKIFEDGSYKLIAITGNKRLKGAHLDMYENDGEYTAATLVDQGFDPSRIIVVPVTGEVKRDRTFASALALKAVIKNNDAAFKSFNLVTLGCHARRSRLLFQKAMGSDVEVGVIAVSDESYDAKIWWKSSNGFREVVKENIAWIYARLFFSNDKS
jgi:uncharacterized SAM-binding protein YcdF (DUF218 family)